MGIGERMQQAEMRLAALPGDEAGLTLERIEDTLLQRQVLQNWKLTGNRWTKWKNGDGRPELLTVLQGAAPTLHAPVTMVQAAVLGMISERLYSRFKKRKSLLYPSPFRP
jgi:hypothetical protein